MKALVGAFNQEKALVGAFSVIVQPVVEPMEHYTALIQADLDHVDSVLRQLEKPGSCILAAAGEQLGLEDGENSSDCGVVPSIDREHLDTGGFNLLADKVGYTGTLVHNM